MIERRGRELEKRQYFREQYWERVVVEHRIGRLLQLGVQQSRYFRPTKTYFQLLMAATVAKPSLVVNWMGPKDAFCSFLRWLFDRLWALTAFPALIAEFRATGERSPVAVSV